MIIARKIRWKNMLSTGNEWTEIVLNTTKTTLIVGENGAGKSTLLDAISYLLFNKPFRKINKPQLINSVTRKNMLVEGEFNINGHEYFIRRGMKPNIFEVYKNGTLINQSAAALDYQDILEKQILKVKNHKSFCQVVILGSASYVPFMQLPAGQRREIIEDLLDLQIFTVMNTLLKTKLSDNNQSLMSVESEKHVAEERIRLMREHLEDLKARNVESMQAKKNQIVEFRDNINKAQEAAYILSTEISLLNEQVADEQKVRKRAREMDRIRIQLSEKVTTLGKEISFFHEYDNCPTCRQQIDEIFKAETIKSRESKVAETQQAMELLQDQYNETSRKLEEIAEIQSQIQKKNIELSTINTRITGYLESIERLNNEINAIKEQHSGLDISGIMAQEEELKRLKREHERLINEKEILAAASLLLKDGGIKARIIKQYIPIINKLINKYLSAMDFFVNFELNENFEETIGSRFRDDFSYASFSEGEKMRINLAILFAWRAVAKLRNSINTNILIMDEVMDSSLDNNGTEEFLKILEQITGDSNVFIISHKQDQIGDKFERVLKFAKHSNFSKLEEAA